MTICVAHLFHMRCLSPSSIDIFVTLSNLLKTLFLASPTLMLYFLMKILTPLCYPSVLPPITSPKLSPPNLFFHWLSKLIIFTFCSEIIIIHISVILKLKISSVHTRRPFISIWSIGITVIFPLLYCTLKFVIAFIFAIFAFFPLSFNSLIFVYNIMFSTESLYPGCLLQGPPDIWNGSHLGHSDTRRVILELHRIVVWMHYLWISFLFLSWCSPSVCYKDFLKQFPWM